VDVREPVVDQAEFLPQGRVCPIGQVIVVGVSLSAEDAASIRGFGAATAIGKVKVTVGSERCSCDGFLRHIRERMNIKLAVGSQRRT
jgi:hypothetical protein